VEVCRVDGRSGRYGLRERVHLGMCALAQDLQVVCLAGVLSVYAIGEGRRGEREILCSVHSLRCGVPHPSGVCVFVRACDGVRALVCGGGGVRQDELLNAVMGWWL